jgi:hypothetical protein
VVDDGGERPAGERRRLARQSHARAIAIPLVGVVKYQRSGAESLRAAR